MNNRFFVMLVIALILAGGAAWMAKNWVESQVPQSAEAGLVPIVAASIDIPFGTKITVNHVKLFGWPKEHLPKGALTDTKLVIDKIAQRAFVTDEALLEPQVKDKAVGSILSALIPEGKRAMSVRVDDVAGVAGFITPGNMVDIIATGKTGKSHILLSNVKVLAIDQLASPEQDKPAVVRALTLEVTVEDSTKLVKAMRDGPLYFTLRNPVDKKDVAENPTTETEVVQSAEEKKEVTQVFVKKSVKRKPCIRIIPWPNQGGVQQATKGQDDEEC